MRRLSLLHSAKKNPFARQPGSTSQRPDISSRVPGADARAPGRVAQFVNGVETATAAVASKDGRVYRFLMYLKDNIGGLSAYQILLEGLVTAYFFAGLQSGQFTTQGLKRIFVDKMRIPDSIVDFEGAAYTDDYEVPYSGKKINKDVMTNIHTAHNVAMTLIPLQMIFILCSYPIVSHAWASKIHPRLSSVPVISKLVSKPMMPKEFADKVMWATAAKRNEEITRQAKAAKIPMKNKSGFRR